MYLGFEGNGGIKRKGKVIRDNFQNFSNSNSITFMLQKIGFNFFFISQAIFIFSIRPFPSSAWLPAHLTAL